ncbi:14605_t:CDS:1 [Funneliformis geosporum]|uniref:3763_t:CDS:1 n=1 Tax=Funneliformis geosporum TaxID=1117311 RepID=A0A9W4SF84_9GLOM|nr:14605_t:CDS:1 [Funneliformis geosporum]CAI2166357.1 3763_t:CDS:1 [Funneliformis geosporum]
MTYILYLEPSKTSKFYKSIQNFFDQTLKLYGPNEALQYPPHCSMTGFFILQDDIQRKINQIIELIDLFLESHKNEISNSSYAAIQLKDIICISARLLISLQVYQPLHQLVQLISNLDSNIRPKRIDHISLAYCSNSFAECRQKLNNNDIMQNMLEFARELIEFDEANGGGSWDIVFYENLKLSQKLDEQHIFREIKRWRI